MELNKPNWGLIYCFIKGFYEDSLTENNTVLDELLKIATIKSVENDKFIDKNAYSSYGKDLTFDILPKTNETIFSILYQKQNTNRDISNIVPFYFLYKKFEGKITLGINLDCFSKEEEDKQTDFTFPCRTFLEIFKNTKPVHGENTVYFINEINKKTGECFRTPTATFRNQSDEKHISRYILPLTIIDKELFYPLFKGLDYENEKINSFSIAIDKQDKTLNDSRLPTKGKENKNLPFRSVFEEWFIKAYCISLDTKIKDEYFDGLIHLLKSYCENIKELVENIIFHTDDKQGLIYVIFQKKENLTVSQSSNLVHMDSYNDLDRFVEIGIMDYNEKGIIDKYNGVNENEDKASTELIDFFDTKKIHTTELDHLDLRYAAHLGIKTFANSVKNHNGSFYVESNNNGAKEAIAYYLGKLPDASEKMSYFYNGTHYEIIFPVKGTDVSYKSYKSVGEIFLQKTTFSDKFKECLTKEPLTNKIIDITAIPDTISTISSKKEQMDIVNNIGYQILNSIEATDVVIVINMKNSSFEDVGLLLKLLAYIQLNKSRKFTHIILTNLSNNFVNAICERIDAILIKPFETETEKPKIWSNDTALVLMTSDLRYQIICGETKEMIGSINNTINMHYPSISFQ